LPGTLTGRLNCRDRDRDQPSAQGKKNSGKMHFVGARGARARFTNGVREHHRRRTHPGASTDNAGTRTRGRVGVRARGFARAHPPATAPRTARARYALRAERARGPLEWGSEVADGAINTHTHTHTYRHRRLWDWIDYLSIFRVKNEVSVAKIASIILSIFRVKTIDYRFRFLE
jgi:hypothetical protein